MGMNGKAAAGGEPRPQGVFGAAVDPFDMFNEFDAGWRPRFDRAEPQVRAVRNVERKALDTLGLEANASKHDIKTRFKVLVKRHHPDANGGDRSSEDRLRDIIQAYNYLKSAGFC